MKNKKKLGLKKMNIAQLGIVKGGYITQENRNTLTDLSDTLRVDCHMTGLGMCYPIQTNPTIC